MAPAGSSQYRVLSPKECSPADAVTCGLDETCYPGKFGYNCVENGERELGGEASGAVVAAFLKTFKI